MKYTIKNNHTGRTYEVESAFESTLDVVWASQRHLFSVGSHVTITDENGNSESFKKVPQSKEEYHDYQRHD